MEKERSFEYFCIKNNKLELLKLYDKEKNKEKIDEVYYSGSKNYYFKCPVCNNSWQGKMNKMNKLSKGNYNVIKKREEITYCPYCKGTRVSKNYNLTTEYKEILDYWDFNLNKVNPEILSPKTHTQFYLKCKNDYCDYKSKKKKKVRDFVRNINNYKCPKCSGGKNSYVTSWNNLEIKYPKSLKEWDYGRNKKLPKEYLPSSNEKVWWVCKKNHHYLCRINNKVFLNRGCPFCYSRHKTSFIEQTIYFYIKKCFFDAENRILDKKTEKEIDIFIPSKEIAIEISGHYFHKNKKNNDRNKLLELANYYKVYSIQEYDEIINHPLIETITLPVFIHNRKCYERYNDEIYKIIKKIDPNLINYPNINIERDTIEILNSYIENDEENSFEQHYPILSRDWDYNKNGNLTPSMFKYSNCQYKFNWICTNCGSEYKMSMQNRVKIKSGTCPKCNIKNNSLDLEYPSLIPYWHSKFNEQKISEAKIYSEKIAIFKLKDNRCVPVKICNITYALKINPNLNIDQYLENALKNSNKLYIN